MGDTQNGLIATPGSVIKDIASKAVSNDLDYILQADSISEYIGAVANSMIGSVMKDGLASVSIRTKNRERSSPPTGSSSKAINQNRFAQEKGNILKDINKAISLRTKGQAFYDNASGSLSLIDAEAALASLEYLRDELYIVDERQDFNLSASCSENFSRPKRLQNRILPNIEDMVKSVEGVMSAFYQAVDDNSSVNDQTSEFWNTEGLVRENLQPAQQALYDWDHSDNRDILGQLLFIKEVVQDLENNQAGRQTLTDLRGSIGGSAVVDAREFEDQITKARKILSNAYDMLTESPDQSGNFVDKLSRCIKHRAPEGSYEGGVLSFPYRDTDNWGQDSSGNYIVPTRPFPWE